MKIQLLVDRVRAHRQAGYVALFIVMVLVAASVLLLGATLTRSTSNVRLNDRNSQFIGGSGAAEAAVEKVLARMMIDFANYGEGQVLSNLSLYATNLPSTSECAYWSNFIWSDAQGHDNQIYIARTSTTSNASFVALEEQYAGLSGYSSTYRILANCRLATSTYNYTFTNAVQYDVQLAQIPVFQFAIFYNGLLEFSDCAPLTNNGPVHANSNIYVGSPSALVFNGEVTTTGNVTDPANMGMAVSQWTGTTSYNGKPSPGWLTGQPALTLPLGTNSTSGSNAQQILYPPQASDSSAMSAQRYYNKAQMTIWISNNNTYTINMKATPTDPGVTFTNLLSTLTNSAASNYFPFLTTSNNLYDQRELKTMNLTQIDVGKLTNWMQTNAYVYGAGGSNKFSSAIPFNIIWVGDWRTTSSTNSCAVRLVNGTNLPSTGLTVATPNPIYVWGNYNTPTAANLSSTNVAGTAPASFASDAFTVLSANWTDSKSFSGRDNVNAAATTIDAAVITGNVPSTGTTQTTFSGGAHNLPRLLENWGSTTLTLNTSMVCVYQSAWATGQFLPPSISSNYYTAPSRLFNFNLNYTMSSGMPPGTPYICRLVRASWCNPEPNDTTYYSETLDFVPQ